jgi:hemerythrin-like domain-containing protein
MAVTLGAKPEHGFDEPLGLLGDCHRRIERFLDILQRVLNDADGGALNEEHRRAVEAALTYFKSAAPRHTQDEEQSLFPLLRGSDSPQVHEALSVLDSLEHDHSAADVAHAEVEFWYRRWMDLGPLARPQSRKLKGVLDSLQAMYRRHIEVEDRSIFPLADQILNRDQRARIGQEMAERRGLSAKLR